MAVEIERKFLLAADGWRAATSHSQAMAQGYLNDLATVTAGRQKASVRVRVEGQAAFLNIKSAQAGPQRLEFDYPIPVAEAEQLLGLCVGGLVRKRRHYVRHGAHLWEIDEFEGPNAGLVVAEIELEAVDAPFARPDWLGAEVTELRRYYNLALAARPYAEWDAGERAGPPTG